MRLGEAAALLHVAPVARLAARREETREARSLAELEGASDRLRELVKLSERAVGRAPERADSHLVLATCLQSVGRLAEAVAACQRAVALEPDSLEVRRLLKEVEKAK